MKILIITVILVASVAIIASISLVAIPDTQVHTCTLCLNIPSSGQPLEITNLSIEPSTVTLGTSFLIYADVFNPNPYSIYVNNGCISSISATFDKNVEIQKGISCFSMSKQEIPSLQKIRIHGPSIGTIYNATSVGNTNATITISYVAAGVVSTITTSKFFIIDTPSPTPHGSTLEEQLGLASYDSMPITKENTFGVNASVIHDHKKYTCPADVPCFNPLVYYLVIYSKSQTFLLHYNICDGNSCVKEGDGNTQMLGMSGVIVRLPDYGWKDGDYVNILVQLPANGSLIFDKNSTYDSVHTPKIWVDLGKSKIVSEY